MIETLTSLPLALERSWPASFAPARLTSKNVWQAPFDIHAMLTDSFGASLEHAPKSPAPTKMLPTRRLAIVMLSSPITAADVAA
jgi:hypothetical protein